MPAPGAVTVVVPCYNYGQFLERCVRAALDQEGVQVRVVIVDDASPDGSGDVADALAAADDRITVLRHETNAGHIRTYNDGFELVETEFVTLVSADDIVAPGAFARAVALMRQHPTVGLVYGDVEVFSDEPHPLVRRGAPRARVIDGARWAAALVRSTESQIRSPEAVLRTTALREVGPYNPALPRTADLEYWLRVALRWDVGRIVGATQAFYRVHGDNMHLTEHHDLASKLRHRYWALEPILGEPGGDRLHAAARRRLAQDALRHAHRALVLDRFTPHLAEGVAAADEIWPEWRTTRRWRHLAASLDAREAGARPTTWTRVSGLPLAHADRVRYRALRALKERSAR